MRTRRMIALAAAVAAPAVLTTAAAVNLAEPKPDRPQTRPPAASPEMVERLALIPSEVRSAASYGSRYRRGTLAWYEYCAMHEPSFDPATGDLVRVEGAVDLCRPLQDEIAPAP